MLKKELSPSMDEQLDILIRIEHRKEFKAFLEENLNELMPMSPIGKDEMRLLKNVIHLKLPSSPKTSSDKWGSACGTLY